jgi:hypothetical protein
LFLDEVRPHVSDRRLPVDRGFLAWLRYHGLAVPAAEMTKVPRWLTDPALAKARIALAPTRGYRQASPDTDVIEVDGRVAALHMLVAQAANNSEPTGVPHDAVTRILEWFAGPHAAHWSSASEQCLRVRFTLQNAGNNAFYSTWTMAPVEWIREVIVRAVPIVPEGWRRPPPTTASCTPSGNGSGSLPKAGSSSDCGRSGAAAGYEADAHAHNPVSHPDLPHPLDRRSNPSDRS